MPFETAPTYIFDLHCDTLDRLALHKSFPDAGFMEQDSAIPDARMSSLANNDCHIALDRMAKAQYAWCQCFAAFIPDHMPADWGWQVFCAVRDFSPSMRRSLNRCTTLAIFAALSTAGNALACSRSKADHSSRARSIACTQLPTRA